MAANLTVFVKNIAPTTEEKQIRDFFSFCGKISDLKIAQGAGNTKDANVTFEKETAAKTAQLLNNTQLDGSQITVTPADGKTDDGALHSETKDGKDDEITQEEKPRARILAEYLAHGYVVGDAALLRAIELDQKHGVTNRFMTTLTNLDQKYHASDRAKAADQSYGLSARAGALGLGLWSYFEKASGSPTGQKVVKFYTDGQRQVQDIHAEARRLAELKKDEHGGDAYKASGLERFLGKQAEKPAAGTENEKADATTSSVPEPGPKAGTMESTPIAPTEGVPAIPGEKS